MPEVSTLGIEDTWEEDQIEDHRQRGSTWRQFMGHAMREMVPTGVNIWGGKRLGRLRWNCWVVHMHGLKGKESILAITSLLKWGWWIVFEWFHFVFYLPIIFFSQQHSLSSSMMPMCLWRDIKGIDCCRTCCLPYSDVLKGRFQDSWERFMIVIISLPNWR